MQELPGGALILTRRPTPGLSAAFLQFHGIFSLSLTSTTRALPPPALPLLLRSAFGGRQAHCCVIGASPLATSCPCWPPCAR